MMTNGIYLLLGSNLGDRMAYMAQALELIEKQIGEVKAQSSLYETAAWGKTNQAPFLNQVLEVNSERSPRLVLEAALDIEQACDRTRQENWGPRSLDVDILYYGDLILESKRLVLPHPRLHLRRFTLVPLCEIAPLLVHPVFGKNHLQLLQECEDGLEVKIVD